MLNTLIEIGKTQSEERHPWEDFLMPVRIDEKIASKNKYLLRILFDCDRGEIVLEDGLRVFVPEPDKLAFYGLIDILKGNNKAIYVAVSSGNLDKMGKALFGNTGRGEDTAAQSEFQEAIQKVSPALISSDFYEALEMIKSFRSLYYEKFTNDKGKLEIRDVTLGAQDVIMAVYAAITFSSKGWHNKPLAELEGYRAFIEQRFFSSSAKSKGFAVSKLCYATGVLTSDVSEPTFSARYNLNKIFQSTTVNYVENFDLNNLSKNYQLSEQTRLYLDRGSEKILSDFKVQIGGLPHACIPRLPTGAKRYNINDYQRLKNRTDLIFKNQALEVVLDEMDAQADDGLYWIDFYGFDSDGNFLKIINHIQNVSGYHIRNMIDAFRTVSKLLKPYLKGNFHNLSRMYYYIPVRKDLKSNAALELCKSVLEERQISEYLLWNHFAELVKCHWFERYPAYSNITDPKKEDIINALLRDAVFAYLAFRKVLIQLNLLKMDKDQKKAPGNYGAQLDAELNNFLNEMDYTAEQRALFFLGKALKRVVRVQREERKSKTALDMVNFNGLDERAIRNLASSILEKGRQYDAKYENLASNLEFDLNRFFQFFPAGVNTWKMDNKEALFYFLSGYTHFIPKKETEVQDTNLVD